MLVLLLCCLIVNQVLRVNSVECKDGIPFTGTINAKGLKKYIDSKIQEDVFKIVEGWQTIFVACSGNGQSMLGAYKKVDYKSEITHQDCSSGHLRSSLINKWNSHKIDEVKIELIKGGDVVKVFVFDGTGSTNMNWFDKQRLVKSSYNDLSKSSKTNFFSIIGDTPADRHFYINRNYGGCSNDKGWLMVVDTPVGNHRPCRFDKLSGMKYPYIVHGPNNNVGHYEKTGQYEVADKLVISIKTFGTPLTSKWSTVVN